MKLLPTVIAAFAFWYFVLRKPAPMLTPVPVPKDTTLWSMGDGTQLPFYNGGVMLEGVTLK